MERAQEFHHQQPEIKAQKTNVSLKPAMALRIATAFPFLVGGAALNASPAEAQAICRDVTVTLGSFYYRDRGGPTTADGRPQYQPEIDEYKGIAPGIRFRLEPVQSPIQAVTMTADHAGWAVDDRTYGQMHVRSAQFNGSTDAVKNGHGAIQIKLTNHDTGENVVRPANCQSTFPLKWYTEVGNREIIPIFPATTPEAGVQVTTTPGRPEPTNTPTAAPTSTPTKEQPPRAPVPVVTVVVVSETTRREPAETNWIVIGECMLLLLLLGAVAGYYLRESRSERPTRPAQQAQPAQQVVNQPPTPGAPPTRTAHIPFDMGYIYVLQPDGTWRRYRRI